MKSHAVILKEFGEPKKVLFYQEINLPGLSANQVLVEMKAAPINPADINLVEGKYGILPELPAVPGNEGLGIVAETGKNITNFSKGDTVIFPNQLGAWSRHRICETHSLIKVKNSCDLLQGAMLAVNPPTAWRLLNDFVELEPGDWIIQNAANSSVGQLIIQFAKSKRVKTVNIVRRASLIQELKDIGADIVIIDQKQFSRVVKKETDNAEIKLGINAVGGQSAKEIAKSLVIKGKMVTYGAMGMEPVTVGNALLIFKNISFHGFWISAWFKNTDSTVIANMFNKISDIIQQNNIAVSIEKCYPLDHIHHAVTHAQKSKRNGKIMLTME